MDLSVVLNPPVHDWTYQQPGVNTTASEVSPDIVVDSTGNSYVVYMTNGTTTGGTHSGLFDIAVCKISSSGKIIWVRQQPSFNTIKDETTPRIGIDAANNVYITYLTEGTVSGGTQISLLDIVVMKMDSNGNVLWIKQNASTSTPIGNAHSSIAVSSEGNVYVAYNSKGTASSGTQSGDDDIIVFKMSTDGTVVWIKQNNTFNTSLFDIQPSIAIDAFQNVYVSFFTSGTVSGGTKLGSFDIAVFKLNSSGDTQWVRQLPNMNTTDDNREPSIAVSASGDIYVAYATYGTVSGGSTSGGYDIALFKLDTTGALQWVRQLPAMNTPDFEQGVDLILDRQGFIYGTYTTDGTIPGESRVGTQPNIIIFKMNPVDGTLLWILQKPFMNSDGSNGSPRLTIDYVDNIYVALNTSGALPDGTNTGDFDVAVFKLRQHPFLPLRDGCAHSHGPGTHESIRIGHLRECVEPLAPPLDLNWDICHLCRAPHTRVRSAPSESHRILREAVRCPLYYRNLDTGGLCHGVARTVHRPATAAGLLASPHSTTKPHGVHRHRVADRIRGIEEIAHIVRGPSAGEVTARRRANIEASAQRHAEHFRSRPPPPPCRVFRQGPQTGVPIAPTTPCNIGTQSVDYSNPRA